MPAGMSVRAPDLASQSTKPAPDSRSARRGVRGLLALPVKLPVAVLSMVTVVAATLTALTIPVAAQTQTVRCRPRRVRRPAAERRLPSHDEHRPSGAQPPAPAARGAAGRRAHADRARRRPSTRDHGDRAHRDARPPRPHPAEKPEQAPRSTGGAPQERTGSGQQVQAAARAREEDRLAREEEGDARRQRLARAPRPLRKSDGSPTRSNPSFVDALPGPSSAVGCAEFHHPEVQGAAVPAADLPGGRDRVRDPLGGAGGDQRDRDRLRPQPERVVRRRRGLDAVHPVDLADVRHRRQRGRPQGSLQPGRRDLRRGPLPVRRRLRGRRAPRDVRLQPRRLVRRLGAAPRHG